MGAVIHDVILTPLRAIAAPGGEVLHAMTRNDPGFTGFGEAYFSTIEYRKVKAWKRHSSMTLNLMVPVGEIRFVVFDERPNSVSRGRNQIVQLSRAKNYLRLTVPPGVWMGFQGLSTTPSILLNIADMPHDPNESERQPEDFFSFDWNI